MKKVISLIVLINFFNMTFAQNDLGKSDDAARIVLNTYIPDQIEGLTPSAKNILENKISQIVTKAGMGGSSVDPRFIITANVTVLTKDITSMHAYTLEVTLYIGDGIEGTKFASTSITLKGVGVTETKAYIAALKNIKVDDPKYQAFIDQGKKKIIEYYNANCDLILKEAQTLSEKGEYDAAIAKLVGIPSVSKSCYDKAMSAVGPIFQKQIDQKCAELIAKAKGVWSASQDANGAQQATAILGEINPQSKCVKDADGLYAELKKRVKELDQREWNMQVKQQQDAVDIEKARIKAARDVGVAYGKNQPKVVYNIRWW